MTVAHKQRVIRLVIRCVAACVFWFAAAASIAADQYTGWTAFYVVGWAWNAYRLAFVD